MGDTLPVLSRADKAPEAAQAQRELVTTEFVDITTPQTRPPHVGDTLETAQISPVMGGGTEAVVSYHEDPDRAYQTYRLSPLWEPIIDAIVANVYGAGYTLQPIVNPDEPGGLEQIRAWLAYDKVYSGSIQDFDKPEPKLTDAEVQATAEWIRNRIKRETIYADAFFINCTMDRTYLELSTLTGQDMEIHGTGYWEVTRGTDGRPARILWAPAWSIKARPVSEEIFAVRELVKISPIRWEIGTNYRRFRSYVQVDGSGNIVSRYKEYGDPRVMSRKTGKYYASLDEMWDVREEWYEDQQTGKPSAPAQPATELLSFQLPCSASYTYGKSKATGVIPSLRGSRELDEENRRVVTDQKIPQMIILVAGGKGIAKPDLIRFREQMEENLESGRKGIYFLHAQGTTAATGTISSAPAVKIERTKSEQHTDALGLNYQEYNYNAARRAYRMSKVSLGDETGINRATALTMRRLTETEVYDPRRDLIDARKNTTILRDLGCLFIQHKTRSRVPREPTELAEIIATLCTAGVLTPDEARQLVSDIFNRSFDDLVGAWSKIPTRLLTAILQTKNQLAAAAVLGSEEEMLARLQQALFRDMEEQQQGPSSRGEGDDDGGSTEET